MHSSPFLKKLFVAFFLIATGYAFIAAGVWFYKNNEISNIKQNVDERSYLQQAKSQMDMRFMVAVNMIQELKSNPDMIQYASDSDNYYYINQVYNRLRKSSIAFNNFGYRIDVVERSSDLVITPNKTIDTESYYKEMGFKKEHLEQIGEYVSSKPASDILFIRHMLSEPGAMPDNRTFTIIKKETVNYASEIIFIITFSEKLFIPDSSSSDQSAVGFMKSKELILAKSGLGGVNIVELLSSNPVIGQFSSYLQTDSGNHHIHTIGSSEFEEILYFYITTKHPFISKIKSLSWEVGTVYVLLLLLGFGVAFVISKNVYKPVRNVVSSIWTHNEVRGRDEFSLITEKISSLQHSNDWLQEAVNQSSKVLKRTFLRDLTYGALSEEALHDGLRREGLNWLNEGGSVVLVRWIEDDLAMVMDKTELAAIEDDMVTGIQKLIQHNMEWFEFKNHHYIFLIGEKHPAAIKKTMSQVMYDIHNEYGISMLVAIGQQADQVREWEQSFHTAVSMLGDHSALSRQSILTYDEYSQAGANHYYYPLELEREIIHMTIQRKMDRLEALIHHVFQENLERREIGRDMLNQWIHSLINTIRRILHQLNESEESLFGPGAPLLKQMKSSGDVDGLKDIFMSSLALIVNHIQRKNEEMDDSMSDRMMAFIHENYQKDISLVDLSEHFNASPAYISILFKDYTGENFKDYLSLYRVNQAKALLKSNKHLKIHEVAGMVGCNHSNTFIRIFKKYEGISPGTYSKQLHD